ncbi:hypothetical protein [Caulobacter sp. LARHSG274]
MIETAEEFARLRVSQEAADCHRAANAPASLEVWLDVIERFPELKVWVAHNKTAPVEVLRRLAEDADPEVRFAVATKRKLDRPLFELLSQDVDDGVRARIAWNAKTPEDIRQRLAADPSPLVSEAASKSI